MIIAVNLNGDLLGRHFASDRGAETTLPSRLPSDFLDRLLKELPAPLREQATQIAPRLLLKGLRRPDTSTYSPIASTLCRTTSREPGLPASRHM